MGRSVAVAAVAAWLCMAPAAALGEGLPPEALFSRPLDGAGSGTITAAWRDCMHAFHAGRHAELLVQLDRLRQAELDAGIRNLSALSSVLMQLAQEVAGASAEATETALALSKHAELLSPDVPEFYFARSNLVWSHDKGMLGEYAGDYFRGVKAAFTYPPSVHGMLLAGIGVVWGAGIIVMLLFSLMLLVRYLALFGHDLSHLLPFRLSRLQSTVIGLIVLLVPFLLDLGLVPLVLFWWVCLWIYQARTERVASVSLVLFIYLWPVLNIVFAGSLAFPTSPEAKAVVCSYDECDTSDFAALQAAAREPDADSGLKYALALARLRLAGMSAEGHLGVDERASDRRCSSAELAALDARLQRGQLGESGPQVLLSARQWVGVHCVDNLEEAAALLSDLSDKRGSPRLKSGVNVALGNARFIDGMRRCMASGNVAMGSELFERAEVHYDLALKADPRSWEALFDKAKVLLVKGDYSASREHTSKAAALHPEAVAAMEKRSQLSEDTPCGSVFNANRELAVVPPAFPAISRLGSGPQDAQEVRAQLPAAHALLVGPLEPWTLVALSTAALLLFALLSFTRRHLKPSSRCIKCGDISCVRCRPELAGTGLCDRCVYYKIRSSYVDPKETWLREKRIEHRFRVRQRLEALLTFLLPGAGHLLRGRPLRGGLFLFAFACALGVILFSPAVAAFASLQTGVTAGSAVGTVFWSVLAFLVYFLSLLDIYSWR